MKFKLMQNYEECAGRQQSFHSFVTYVLFGNYMGNALVTERTLYSASHFSLETLPNTANSLIFSKLSILASPIIIPLLYGVYSTTADVHMSNS